MVASAGPVKLNPNCTRQDEQDLQDKILTFCAFGILSILLILSQQKISVLLRLCG
jgi:hypothetical protein